MKREFGDNLTIPNIDPIAVEVLQCTTTPFREGNNQTDRILKALEMDHIWTVPAGHEQFKNAPPPPQLMVPVSQNIPLVDPNEIDI